MRREALDDGNRVPVNVVVDDGVRVLQVLALGDAVGGDQQVQLAFIGELGRALFGLRRKGGQHAGEVGAQAGQIGLVAARTGDQRAVQAQLATRPVGNAVVQIEGGIGERREDDGLAVRAPIDGVDRLRHLVFDQCAQRSQLGIAGAVHRASVGQQASEAVSIFGQVLAPANAVCVLQQHLDLLPCAMDLLVRFIASLWLCHFCANVQKIG